MSPARAGAIALLVFGFANCADDERSVTSTDAPSFSVASGSKYYVSPTGSSGGNGSLGSPWSLDHALRGAKVGGVPTIVGGDTVFLLGGTYTAGDPLVAPGKWIVTVSGNPSGRVVFRENPGADATIEDAYIGANGTPGGKSQFNVQGSYLEFRGFEFRNVNPDVGRVNRRPDMVYNQGSNNRYYQLIIHDGGVGFYTEPAVVNVRVVGCIIYNIGYQGSDRGHGHALYLRSNNGPLNVSDNVMFNTFGYGVHAFTELGAGLLKGMYLFGNVAFNSGTLSNNSNSANILLGGNDLATGDTLSMNNTYFTPGLGGINVQVGYGTLRNGSVTLDVDNYFVGGSPVFDVGYWSTTPGSFSLEGITLVGSNRIIRTHDPAKPLPYDWYGGTHWRSPTTNSWGHGIKDSTFAWWGSSTGLGGANVAQAGTPTVTEVRGGSMYGDAGQALGGGFITIYNWGNNASVNITWFCSMVPGNGTYKVHSVQNLSGTPVKTGSCAGTPVVNIPIVATTPPTPIGMSSPGPSTGTAFVVYRVSSP